MNKRFKPLLGKRIRVTTLDACANIPEEATPNAMGVTDGYISTTLSSEVEDGNEILTRKADGSICVNERTDASFKFFSVEIVFCGVDPGILSVVSNAEIYEDWNGDVAGLTVAEGTISKRFAFEQWMGLSGTACDPDVDEASAYMLLPFVGAGVIGDIEVTGEDAVNFTITGAQTLGGNQWGQGPYDVVLDDNGDPAPLPTPLDPMDHLLILESGLALPADAAGLQPMPAHTTHAGVAA